MKDLLCFRPVSELISLLDKQVLSSVELTKSFIERTKELEPKLHAFLSYDEAKTLKEAEESDKRRSDGKTLSKLDGIPVGLKDLIAEEGQSLTCGSKMLENFISPYDSTVVKKLKASGAVLWGRLNMDEFAMGSSSENSAFQFTANPWNTEYVPGGSSSGSVVAVASGQVPISLGSDTGGSVRQPAALCGVVGLKPTYGRISRYGLVAYASSLEQVGPFGRTVEDIAHILGAIAGKDSRDSTSAHKEVPDYLNCLQNIESPKVLGVPKEFFGQGLDDEVRDSVKKAIDFYANQGWQIKEVSLPHVDLSIPLYYVIATAEASSNLARYDGIRYTKRTKNSGGDIIKLYEKTRDEGFGAEVKRRILLGTYVLSGGHQEAFYQKAQKLRTLLYQDFTKAFESVDALITPTSPFPAFKKGEKTSDPIAMYLSDVYTASVNLAGLPGLSIPCGFSSSGLPIGLQLIGKPFAEGELLGIAKVFESAHDYVKIYPKI